MSNVRVKDIATTATLPATDDFFAIDGATNSTRKLPTSAVVLNGGSATITVLDSGSSPNLTLQTGGATRGQFSSTGLAVTGTGTALTVNSTSGSGLAAAINSTSANGTFFAVQNSGTAIGFIGDALNINAGTLGDLAIRSQGTGLDFGLSGSRYMRLTSTGLAVTGTTYSSSYFLTGASNGGGTGNAWFRGGGSLASWSGIDISDSSDTSSAAFAAWRNAGGTACGTITRVGTTNAVAYNTTSDARLKTNVRDYDSGSILDLLRPRIFDWKSGHKDSIGFIAQELYEIYPQAVSKGDDGDEITREWGVDFSKLVPVLVAELKALRARVAQLEAHA